MHVPRRLQELRVDLARAREELEGRGIHEPRVADFAAHLGLGEEEVMADLIGNEDPALALAEDLQALKPHLAQLDERERTLIELRFGAEMTQTEIGREMGLSQMHISRLLARALVTLREGLLAEA